MAVKVVIIYYSATGTTYHLAPAVVREQAKQGLRCVFEKCMN